MEGQDSYVLLKDCKRRSLGILQNWKVCSLLIYPSSDHDD